MKPKVHPSLFQNESGMALVIALILMVVLTLLGLASSLSSNFEIKLSGNKRGSTDAFYASDSGVQVVKANINNFDLQSKYVENKYNPFSETDKTSPYYNPNPTQVKANITYLTDQQGSPRGLGFSASGNYEFRYFSIESIGEDLIDFNPIRSNCTVQEKVVRLTPTLQGGN